MFDIVSFLMGQCEAFQLTSVFVGPVLAMPEGHNVEFAISALRLFEDTFGLHTVSFTTVRRAQMYW